MNGLLSLLNEQKNLTISGKKGTEMHKAAVVGDTVGDPFKDTSGPSLNILLKLMSVVALVIAPSIAISLEPEESGLHIPEEKAIHMNIQVEDSESEAQTAKNENTIPVSYK